MSSMSASDAAPLPRLGEVYFDVRGESRSMRLSWYADTGVAVFSIWQGGTCTGTFRLPIADLPRMIATLQRGPQGSGGEQPGAARQRGIQGRAPGPEMPDSEIRTGQNAMPPPRHAEGRAPARHGAEPAAGYADGRPAGDYAEPETGYVGGHAGGGYAGEPGSGYGQERGYPAPGGTHGYQDEPPREYLDPPARDRRDEPSREYLEPAGRDHRDEPREYPPEAPGDYGHTGGHGRYDEPARPAHAADSIPGRDPRDEPSREYLEPPPGRGRRGARAREYLEPAGRDHRDEPREYLDEYGHTGGHGRYDEQTGAYDDDSLPGGYRGGPAGGFSGGGYEDEPTGVYHGDLLRDGYADEPGEHYREASYTDDPLTGDYPAGPAGSAIDTGDYPAASGNSGYSHARPYVAPLPGDAGAAAEGRRERRRSRGREESDPSPDSFPYGPPPAEREARGRGR